jgi:hypothetical protein
MSKEKKLRDGKKHRRKLRKKRSLADAFGEALEQGIRSVSLSNKPKRRTHKKKKKKTKSQQYWESLTPAEVEAEFNAWNRQQTTGLSIAELTPRTSVQDSDSMLLIVIDLAVDREKVSLMKEGKRRSSLEKLLKRLP